DNDTLLVHVSCTRMEGVIVHFAACAAGITNIEATASAMTACLRRASAAPAPRWASFCATRSLIVIDIGASGPDAAHGAVRAASRPLRACGARIAVIPVVLRDLRPDGLVQHGEHDRAVLHVRERLLEVAVRGDVR